jgi:hypothetical protein
MRVSKVLGVTALFHLTFSAVVLNQGHQYNHAALSRRVEPVPKGGNPTSGGKGGDSSGGNPSSGNPNSGKPAGGNPDTANPNSGNAPGSPSSQNSGNSANSKASAASAHVDDVVAAAQVDTSSGMDTVLTDAEYQIRGQIAIKANKDAINAKPRVDKTYPAMKDSYTVSGGGLFLLLFLGYCYILHSLPRFNPHISWDIREWEITDSLFLQVEYEPDIQPEIIPDIKPLTDYLKLDLDQGWTFVDIHSETQFNAQKSTWIGFVGNDGKNIISTLAMKANDINAGDKKLPSSEIMYQALTSKGNSPSELQNVIRAPIGNKGSLQMMQKAVQAKFGLNADLKQPRSFTSADANFEDLVGDYVCKLPEHLSPFSYTSRTLLTLRTCSGQQSMGSTTLGPNLIWPPTITWLWTICKLLNSSYGQSFRQTLRKAPWSS